MNLSAPHRPASLAKKQSKKDFVLQEVRVIFVNLFFLQA